MGAGQGHGQSKAAAAARQPQRSQRSAAKELFGRKVLPAAMPTRVHGFYAHGCIAGAEGLPINGDNWQVMRLSRNRYWGHPDLVALVKRLAAKARKDAGWPGILVGDMSQPRGGPMFHRTRQPSGWARRRHLADADAEPATCRATSARRRRP
jgi:murein endopeptidase